ncbi:hypothetical protein B0J11DRAFT_585276 [Dendryphion nanum]|uniref:Uncharacterized protein n=1 Tax=Dendryphion nanum TaxID=256645 RepID=A0A9P9D4Y5_9PLEO|nr:hypothetical protein B0J11DRAFT_585276 [Dendryphion nanum]
MKITLALLTFAAAALAAPVAQGYGSYGDYKAPAGGYASYGDYKNAPPPANPPPPAGGYKDYGSYGAYGSYGSYKRDADKPVEEEVKA